MKPYVPALVVCTATANLAEALPRLDRWRSLGAFEWPLVIVENGTVTDTKLSDGRFLIDRTPHFLGSVGAMARAVHCVRLAYGTATEILVALHDDVEILEEGWDAQVLDLFASNAKCGLAGFSGAAGLGSDDIYQTPYDPMQLARQGFRSNLVDAEAHGRRSFRTERVVCHDGFSLIGRASWWLWGQDSRRRGLGTPWDQLRQVGMQHHGYDSALGLLAHLAGWESWYLPVKCQHLGGRTAVANQDYQAWAQQQVEGGDQGFWQEAHRALYELGRGTLPLRV